MRTSYSIDYYRKRVEQEDLTTQARIQKSFKVSFAVGDPSVPTEFKSMSSQFHTDCLHKLNKETQAVQHRPLPRDALSVCTNRDHFGPAATTNQEFFPGHKATTEHMARKGPRVLKSLNLFKSAGPSQPEYVTQCHLAHDGKAVHPIGRHANEAALHHDKLVKDSTVSHVLFHGTPGNFVSTFKEAYPGCHTAPVEVAKPQLQRNHFNISENRYKESVERPNRYKNDNSKFSYKISTAAELLDRNRSNGVKFGSHEADYVSEMHREFLGKTGLPVCLPVMSGERLWQTADHIWGKGPVIRTSLYQENFKAPGAEHLRGLREEVVKHRDNIKIGTMKPDWKTMSKLE